MLLLLLLLLLIVVRLFDDADVDSKRRETIFDGLDNGLIYDKVKKNLFEILIDNFLFFLILLRFVLVQLH